MTTHDATLDEALADLDRDIRRQLDLVEKLEILESEIRVVREQVLQRLRRLMPALRRVRERLIRLRERSS
jgi:hypothetical protein